MSSIVAIVVRFDKSSSFVSCYTLEAFGSVGQQSPAFQAEERNNMSDAVIEAAKAPIVAYSEKNWDKARASVTPTYHYDEVATHRAIDGIDQVLEVWKGWAKAFPDSKATFHDAFASGDVVVVELTWKGTHTGPLATPDGEVAPTGKSINLRAIQVQELKNGKVASTRQYFDMATLLAQLGLTS